MTLCISNTAQHNFPLTNLPRVNVHVSPLCNSQRDRLHFRFSAEDDGTRDAGESNGWPASCLSLHSTSGDSDLGSGIEFAVSYQTGVLKYSPSLFQGSPAFSMCVCGMYWRRRFKFVLLKPVFAPLWSSTSSSSTSTLNKRVHAFFLALELAALTWSMKQGGSWQWWPASLKPRGERWFPESNTFNGYCSPSP